jgi:hypothetical protein
MCIMKTGLRLLALGLAFIAFASPNYARAAGNKVSAARAAAIHKCSVLAFGSANLRNTIRVLFHGTRTQLAWPNAGKDHDDVNRVPGYDRPEGA